MGSSDGHRNEQPVHTVYLDAYWIDRTEVTNGQYVLCVKAGVCKPPRATNSVTKAQYYGNPAYKDYPVINVNWDEAQTYCEWADRRLPTEAEWEKAARGTDQRLYPWGNQPPNEELANNNWREGDPLPVGSYPEGASPYGALDMAGNVWEWVADWYQIDYYDVSPIRNPTGPIEGNRIENSKLQRGGGWNSSDWFIRSTCRVLLHPVYYSRYRGFRCAQSP
jgi:formylglycine-generating enzyme required for sulfatase activity